MQRSWFARRQFVRSELKPVPMPARLLSATRTPSTPVLLRSRLVSPLIGDAESVKCPGTYSHLRRAAGVPRALCRLAVRAIRAWISRASGQASLRERASDDRELALAKSSSTPGCI